MFKRCCLFAPESSSHVLFFWNDSSSRKLHQNLSLRQARRFIKEPGHADTYVGLKVPMEEAAFAFFSHFLLEMCWKLLWQKFTPCKINMEPTNHPFRKENDLPGLHDYVPAVNPPGCRCFSDNDLVMRNFTWMQGESWCIHWISPHDSTKPNSSSTSLQVSGV